MKHAVISVALALALPGCSLFSPKDRAGTASITGPSDLQPSAGMTAAVATTALGARAVRADALDTTTPEEKAAALAAPAASGERTLGRVVVALGPPAEQGIWLKTSLVDKVVQGRVETAAGKSLGVELRPGTGAALLSLAAFQALRLNLTELPEVTVFGP